MLPPLLTLSSGLIPVLPPALYPRLPLALTLPPHPHNWNSLLKDWKGLSRPFCPVSCGHRKLILAGSVKQICLQVSKPREIKPWDETLGPLKRKTQFTSTEMGGCIRIVSVFCWISCLKVCVWLLSLFARVFRFMCECVWEFRGHQWNHWGLLLVFFLGFSGGMLA